MAIIQKLPQQVADLIAAGEVVERPASAAKELVENAIDAGARNVTVELQNGGMTFLRVTDDGCGMSAEDAETAFLRHATSKLRTAQDLEAIRTLGFRGEALAAISAVSRVDLLTRRRENDFGTSLHLDGGVVTERGEAGCPVGTTIIVRDLFYNTPARLKFMKRDTVEGAAVLAAVQKLALAHPEIAFRVLREGAEQLQTPGDGQLESALYAVLGRQSAREMVAVESKWERFTLSGYVSRPTATRGNRMQQIFFVNGRLVRSKTMTAALEEAYSNRLMVGRYPYCVLELRLPEHLVDVNVHPAKIEVKFLREHDVFDCVRYGVQGALDRASGRVELQFGKAQLPSEPSRSAPVVASPTAVQTARNPEFFRTMTAGEFREFAQTVRPAPRPSAPERPKPVEKKPDVPPFEPRPVAPVPPVQRTVRPVDVLCDLEEPDGPVLPPQAAAQELPAQEKAAQEKAAQEPEQPVDLTEGSEQPYRIVGEVLDTYILVEQGRQLLLIDKHAAHERILFEKFRARQEPILSQLLLTPVLYHADREEAAVLLENTALLEQCGYGISDYGDGTLAVGQIPADLAPEDAAATLGALASDLLAGKQTDPKTLRDNMLHTIACKAAIKGGWHTEEAERAALVRQVLARDDLKYCPHGRPICAVMTAAQLERQFRRS